MTVESISRRRNHRLFLRGVVGLCPYPSIDTEVFANGQNCFGREGGFMDPTL